MKTVSMSGSLRESVGKKDAKKHRAEGRVPCVLYGGNEQVHFTMDEKAFSRLIFTPETFFIDMNIDGKVYHCLLKDVQYHPVSDRVLHADFLEFNTDKPVVMSVPVKLSGNAPGIIAGGVMIKKFRRLPVKALPGNMPEGIDIDVSKLQINDKIHVGDIKQENFTIMEKSERFVCGIKTTRMAASAAGLIEEEGAEGAEGEGTAEGGEDQANE